MELPVGIEQEILEYLHLEYGESKNEPGALKISDLRYEGEYFLNGVATHFWWFPCGRVQCWATVAPFEDSYLIGMTTTSPQEIQNV